ncbi:MAG: DUF3107 family protein [Acidimicrobiia bacterium]|nr:MAG: DUF3107 family protein [Acidimicrobiia bacterium]
MATNARVKIGITFAPREIDVEVEDADAFMAEFARIVEEGVRVWWVTDREQHRHGVLVDKIAYVDVEPERDRKIGFSNQ